MWMVEREKRNEINQINPNDEEPESFSKGEEIQSPNKEDKNKQSRSVNIICL